jgi:GntR family transcriptional regulator
MSAVLPIPKYHQIYLVLHEQLRDGRFSAGVPGEMALMQQFGVARVTVRKALERLSAEGLITREPGRGTRAITQAEHLARSPSSPDKTLNGRSTPPARLTGLLENLVTMGLNTSVTVLDVIQINAPSDVAQALTLQADNLRVQKAVRVRSTKEGPVSMITTYVPEHISCHFGRKELEKKPILLLIEAAGVKVGRAEQTISACLADSEVAKHLGVEVGSALLAVKRLIFDNKDVPIQWLYGLYRPDRYEYLMQLSRVGSIKAKVWVSEKLSAQYH